MTIETKGIAIFVRPDVEAHEHPGWGRVDAHGEQAAHRDVRERQGRALIRRAEDDVDDGIGLIPGVQLNRALHPACPLEIQPLEMHTSLRAE